MMKLLCLLFFTLLNFHTPTHASEVDNEVSQLFYKLDDFSLLDEVGRVHQLSRKNYARYVVFYSYLIECPVCRKDIPTLSKLINDFKKSEVDFYFIDSAKQDSLDAIKDEVKNFKLPFPVLRDETQEIARLLKINRSGEAIVVDTKNFNIVFRGPVDDRQSYVAERRSAHKEYLKDALKGLLKHKKVKVNYVRSIGCALTIRPRPEVTYYKNVAPILDQKCAYCHQMAKMPPSSFFDYDGAKNWSTMIKEVIRTELMPPWEIDPSIKIKKQPTLTSEEKEEIYAWIETGMKEGNKSDFIKRERLRDESKKFINDESSEEFNYSLSTKKTINIKANNKSEWYYELADINNGEDFWINGLTHFSTLSSPNLIEHISLIVAKEEIPDIANYQGNDFFAPELLSKIYDIVHISTVRGAVTNYYADKAFRIPKGARIYINVHFSNTGKDESANIKVVMRKFPKGAQFKEIICDQRASVEKFTIPPNTPSYILKKEIKFDQDVSLYSLQPHMHSRGAYSRVYLKDPDGSNSRLIYNARYLRKIHYVYDLAEPIKIKKGTVMEVQMEFDNSKGNPAVINPNLNVKWGRDSDKDEMMIMILYYTKDN